MAGALKRYVVTRVSTGQLQPGDQIPTERELVEMFGGGRSTVRKALLDLERDGIVAREVGRGTFVKAAPRPAEAARPASLAGLNASPLGELSAVTRLASPADVMELRLMLEPAVVEQVVSRASPAEIDTMYECLEQARHSQTLEDFEHWDDMLHRSFAAASRNPLFNAIYAMISAVRLDAAWGDLKRKTLTEALKRKHFDEHVRIVDAIRARNAALARQEMQQHLDHIRRNMFGLA
ncbi:MAG: FadR family transcriptional regulator [Piscinibacter sp.]|nr:FadR family transcriptional regulator [Piscinibacter sp.]